MCKYVYRYIGCITDQSNWSGPLSLVVVSWGREFDPEIFFTDFSPPTIIFSVTFYEETREKLYFFRQSVVPSPHH